MRLLSLFTGYGGLDAAVAAITGARLVAVSDIAAGACAVLNHHFPDVPNIGDVTELNSADIPGADIICGGYPCQPFSTAGHRRGTSDPRHLWPHLARIIENVRPKAVVVENVRGHLSMGDQVTDVFKHDRLGTNLVNDPGHLEEQVAPVFRVGEPLALALNRERLTRETADHHVHRTHVTSLHLAYVAHVHQAVEVGREGGSRSRIGLVGVRGGKPASGLEACVDTADTGEEGGE